MGKYFTPNSLKNCAIEGRIVDYGLIVDVETTGLNPAQDKILEVGLVEFRIDSGGVPQITSMYSGLEDPGVPISPEISRLTGLTDDSVRGEVIDWNVVRKHWERANVLIAHNAEFDRDFLVRRPELQGPLKHWACSIRHIDWRGKHFGSLKLQYLAADHGFANPFAHRAMFDCATTFRLIAPHLTELMERSFEPEYEIFALGSPFETKDILKQRGYRWDAEQRVWRRRVGARDLGAEREFLATEVYKGQPRHREDEIYFNPRSGSH
jgi:DNA polymerase-3 subunit epsilon